jgi:hypothetical protein
MRPTALAVWTCVLEMTPRDPPDLLRTIDAVVRHRALVFGSLPPGGRDLDLLVLPDDAAAIASRLRDDGFKAWGRGWVSFRGCSASVVELIPAGSLRLPQAELDALFAEGTTFARVTNIVEPASHHTLLILACKLARERASLLPKHRARIDRALARDPAAWERARSRAELWRGGSALTRLRSLYDAEGQPRSRRRLHLRRRRRTRVIALSGVDADRTRSHAELLRETLHRLGFESAVVRPDPLRVKSRGWVGSRAASRARAPVLAVALALSLWRPIWRQLGRGRVLVYERSALDFAVSLSGAGLKAAKPPLAARVLRVLSPTALRLYLFDAADADDGEVPDSRAQAYRAVATAFGALRLEAGRPRDELCEEIAEDAWRALTRRTPLVSAVRDLAGVISHRSGAETMFPPA